MEKYIGKYSVKDFLYLILGAFIYSIGTHSFIETANIAPGGAVGVALMLNHVTNLPVGRLTLMVNVPLFNIGVVSFEPCLCAADGVCVRNLFGGA